MREYFICAECGRNSWTLTDDPSKVRNLCVSCWEKEKELEGVHHCQICGSFAQSGSNKCWRCNRLEGLEIRVMSLNSQVEEEIMQKTICQNHNVKLRGQVKDLDKTVKTYQEKKQYPYEIHVAEYNGICNEEFLKSVLKGAGMEPSALKVTYSRRY